MFTGDAAIGAGVGGVFGVINNLMARWREQEARAENYKYNEMAANNADARTRALYADLQSPKALLEQYKEAGLSPSLMFGGGGVGGQTASGAQGEGASGVSPNTYGINPMDAVNMALTKAQIKKTEAEAHVLDQDADLKEIQKELDEMKKTTYKQEFTILTSHLDVNGTDKSLYQYASEFKDVDAFIKSVKEAAEKTDTNLHSAVVSENGQKILRSIYIARNEFAKDIAVLSDESMSAKFHQQITTALQSTDFANINAQAAVAQLKAVVQTENLTAQQKEAWNNMLDEIGKKSLTGKAILIILGQILDRAADRVNVSIKN